MLCHLHFFSSQPVNNVPNTSFICVSFLPYPMNAGTQRVWVSGQVGLWRRGWGQSPLHLWQHRRWQVPHTQSHPVWWRESLLHIQVSQLLYGGSVGRVRAPARPHCFGHWGPFGCCVQSKSADATSTKGNLMHFPLDSSFKCNPVV